MAAKIGPAERAAAIICGVIFVVICLGCMNFQFGGRNETIQAPPSDERVLTQSGTAQVLPKQEIDVYYPAPLVSPPNLVVSDAFSGVEVIEQKADHFRVKNTFSSNVSFSWTARGMPVPAPPPVQPTIETPIPSAVPIQQPSPPAPMPIRP